MTPDTPPTPRVWAVVPAAGLSRRMGQPKQLLDIRGRPMIRAVLDGLCKSDVAGVVVVTRKAIVDQLPPLPQNVRVVLNDDDSTEMIDSVRLGLAAWRRDLIQDDPASNPRGLKSVPGADQPSVSRRDSTRRGDGFLVCPADQPSIRTADFNACIAAFRENPERIVIAAYQGRRGHPIIFPDSDEEFVRSAACDSGLRELPRAFPGRICLVSCGSPAVIDDVDTPDDLRWL